MRPDLGPSVVYALDFGSGALRSLERLPHVGSVVPGDDPERVQRMLRTLDALLDRRGRAFSEVNAASWPSSTSWLRAWPTSRSPMHSASACTR